MYLLESRLTGSANFYYRYGIVHLLRPCKRNCNLSFLVLDDRIGALPHWQPARSSLFSGLGLVMFCIPCLWRVVIWATVVHLSSLKHAACSPLTVSLFQITRCQMLRHKNKWFSVKQSGVWVLIGLSIKYHPVSQDWYMQTLQHSLT